MWGHLVAYDAPPNAANCGPKKLRHIGQIKDHLAFFHFIHFSSPALPGDTGYVFVMPQEVFLVNIICLVYGIYNQKQGGER